MLKIVQLFYDSPVTTVIFILSVVTSIFHIIGVSSFREWKVEYKEDCRYSQQVHTVEQRITQLLWLGTALSMLVSILFILVIMLEKRRQLILAITTVISAVSVLTSYTAIIILDPYLGNAKALFAVYAIGVVLCSINGFYAFIVSYLVPEANRETSQNMRRRISRLSSYVRNRSIRRARRHDHTSNDHSTQQRSVNPSAPPELNLYTISSELPPRYENIVP